MLKTVYNIPIVIIYITLKLYITAPKVPLTTLGKLIKLNDSCNPL